MMRITSMSKAPRRKQKGPKPAAGGGKLKSGWWREATDVVQVESLRSTNFQRIWKSFNKMAWEARPFLQNVQYDPTGTARHFLGAEVLTQIAEERKIDRRYQTTRTMPTNVTYHLAYMQMDNVKDDKGVYTPDIHSEYEHTRLKPVGKQLFKQDLATIPGLENGYQFDPRYISVLVKGLDEESFKAFKTEGTGTTASDLYKLVKSINAVNEDVYKFKYHQPIFHKHATVDYNIYTVRMTASSDSLDGVFVKIHRRMILVESTFPGSSFKLPLAEELFIELYKKPDKETVGHPVCTDRSFVLTCSAVNTTGAAPTCASMLHFFGQNAFTVDISNASHSSKKGMESSHNLAAFMAGWLIRKMSNISNEFEPLESVFLPGFANDAFIKERANKANPRAATPRQILQTSFLNRQGAKRLLDVDGKKIFYVTLWLSTPTISIICLSPLDDSRKANVFVWTTIDGNGPTVRALPPTQAGKRDAMAKDRDGQGEAGSAPVATTMVSRCDAMTAPTGRSKHGLFSRRLFEHRSTLPDDLERELEAL